MYIIAMYDVNEKRVGKMLKLLRKYLNWIQNSVFEGEITEVKLLELKHKAMLIMDEETDKFEHALPTFKPLVVNITKKPLNGKYITYRSIGNPIQRTIICKY